MQLGRKSMDNLEKAKQKFFKDLRARIERMVTKGAFASEECWEWKGATRAPDDKYGRVKITFLGLQKTVGAHRASYMAFNEVFDLPEDISHTCHMGLCVNPEHLSHEDHVVNMARAQCKANASKCLGHNFMGQVFKPCLPVTGE